MKIDQNRLMDHLEQVYQCGRQPDGTFTRMAFSSEDMEGKKLFISWAEALGMTTRWDAAGNLIARLEGTDLKASAIILCSHLDTVPDGGRFDGALGVIGALEAVQSLKEAGLTLAHPVEIIAFADEEGFRFNRSIIGSNSFCGVDPGIFAEEKDIYGTARGEIYSKLGLDPAKALEAKRDPGTVACTLELHIEQGGSLDQQNIPIGVVSAIAGCFRYEITVEGEANHGGSTKMTDRKDALVAASALIGNLPAVVKEFGTEYTVATVGMVSVQPHSVNVIPGKCVFSLEIRDQSLDMLNTIEREALKKLEEGCKANGCTYTVAVKSKVDPAPLNEQVTMAIGQAAKTLGYPCKSVPSGAYHDSLVLSRYFKAGMIFVPSIGGVSHSRYENTAPEDLAKGCHVLAEAVVQLDKVL